MSQNIKSIMRNLNFNILKVYLISLEIFYGPCFNLNIPTLKPYFSFP